MTDSVFAHYQLWPLEGKSGHHKRVWGIFFSFFNYLFLLSARVFSKRGHFKFVRPQMGLLSLCYSLSDVQIVVCVPYLRSRQGVQPLDRFIVGYDAVHPIHVQHYLTKS